MSRKFFAGKARAVLSIALLTAAGAASAAETAEDRFARMDRDHDQSLSADEFKAGLIPRGRPVVYQRLSTQFRAVDSDHSGYLEATEFGSLAMIEDAGLDAPSMASADTSHDARIDFKEFVAMAVKLDPTKRDSAVDSPEADGLDATGAQEGTGAKPQRHHSRAPYADGVLRLSPSRARRSA